MEPSTQIGMTVFAEFATPAGLSGIDGHASADFKRFEIPVHTPLADGLHRAGKLMTEDERALDRRVADARVLVGMQIAAANPSRGDANQRHAGAGRTGVRDGLQTKIAWAVETGREHLLGRLVGTVGHASIFSKATPQRNNARPCESYGAGKVQLVLMDCSTEVAASLASAAFVSGMRISPPLPSRRRGAE